MKYEFVKTAAVLKPNMSESYRKDVVYLTDSHIPEQMHCMEGPAAHALLNVFALAHK